MVIDADPEFFAITKRLHNRLHGAVGDSSHLGRREAAHYEAVLDANVDSIDGRIHRGDVVFLHDPQTAGLANHLIDYGARVAWRCHIGSDRTNAFTEEAWAFLQPYLSQCRTFVFSHAAFVPRAWRRPTCGSSSPPSTPCPPRTAPWGAHGSPRSWRESDCWRATGTGGHRP
jgi:trehalose synthase